VIQSYNIGSGTRIMIELLPGFLLYPHQQKRLKNMPTLQNYNSQEAYSEFRKNDAKFSNSKKQ
jgi:hypothetical protein